MGSQFLRPLLVILFLPQITWVPNSPCEKSVGSQEPTEPKLTSPCRVTQRMQNSTNLAKTSAEVRVFLNEWNAEIWNLFITHFPTRSNADLKWYQKLEDSKSRFVWIMEDFIFNLFKWNISKFLNCVWNLGLKSWLSSIWTWFRTGKFSHTQN